MGEAAYPDGDLLRGSSPREILKRLIEGDPLELRARCLEQLHTKAFLVCLDRLQLRTVARVAYAAPRWAGDPALGTWLVDRIEISMKELLEEDREAARSGIPDSVVEDARYSFLSSLLGIESFLAQQACVAFNTQSYAVRRAFFAIVIEHTRLNRYVAEGNGSQLEVEEYLKLAFRALGLAEQFRNRASDQGEYDDV